MAKGCFYRFETNEGSMYGPNVNCMVTFKRWASCKRMRVSCDLSDDAFGGPDDFLRVTRETKQGREDYRQM